MKAPEFSDYRQGFSNGHTYQYIQDVREYFYNLHDVEVNQKYAESLPYSFHISLVAAQAIRFKKYIPVDGDIYAAVMGAVYGHDSIEDARLTYNDLVEILGQFGADIVYCCTDEKGKNRDGRKNEKFYKELSQNEYAVFVKMCDMIANGLFSLMANSSMYKKYRDVDYPKFREIMFPLYHDTYADMFHFMDNVVFNRLKG